MEKKVQNSRLEGKLSEVTNENKKIFQQIKMLEEQVRRMEQSDQNKI